MALKGLNTIYIGAGALAGLAAVAVPATVGNAAEMVAAPTLAYDLDSTIPTAGDSSFAPATRIVDLGQPPEVAVVEAIDDDADDVVAADQASHDCMAKVVLHEAGNQSRTGKVAVAQTLVNRLRDGRFGDTICAVANQRGQYFDLSGYRPRRDSDQWADAMDVSRAVLRGDTDAVAPGAMFFRADYAPANSFFRGRKRIAQVGAHVFYR